MLVSLDNLTFSSGCFYCLHLPDVNQLPLLEQHLAEHLQQLKLNGMIARQASLDTVRRRLFRKPTIVEWLVQNGEVSREEADTIISNFPIRVARLLCQNAMNPLRFLGLAAAIAKKPDIIAYQTCGMDPRGRSLIHPYARTHFPAGCLIHIATFPALCVPGCPKEAKCFLIELITESGDGI